MSDIAEELAKTMYETKSANGSWKRGLTYPDDTVSRGYRWLAASLVSDLLVTPRDRVEEVIKKHADLLIKKMGNYGGGSIRREQVQAAVTKFYRLQKEVAGE